jgi:uncharacterized protein
MDERTARILSGLPGKDCGQCGLRTCAALAELAATDPEALHRCVYLTQQGRGVGAPVHVELAADAITWRDVLDREYDFILEQYPEDPGPRETILPFNPCHLERLQLKPGDVVYGRPSSVGCPVTHVGRVMEPPDAMNATVVWCVVGPLAARAGGIELGQYTPLAYEGIVRHTREPLQIGRRYFFLPRYCMLQSRHSAVVAALAQRPEGMRVRVEGIWIE